MVVGPPGYSNTSLPQGLKSANRILRNLYTMRHTIQWSLQCQIAINTTTSTIHQLPLCSLLFCRNSPTSHPLGPSSNESPAVRPAFNQPASILELQTSKQSHCSTLNLVPWQFSTIEPSNKRPKQWIHPLSLSGVLRHPIWSTFSCLPSFQTRLFLSPIAWLKTVHDWLGLVFVKRYSPFLLE